MKIDIIIEFNKVKIFFDDILHLFFIKDEFLGLQSWKTDDRYIIEYILKTNVINCEYDSYDKWKNILKLLNEKL